MNGRASGGKDSDVAGARLRRGCPNPRFVEIACVGISFVGITFVEIFSAEIAFAEIPGVKRL
jgi:hypothetical protein